MFRREMSWFEIIIKAIIAILLLILGFGLGGCANRELEEELESLRDKTANQQEQIKTLKDMYIYNLSDDTVYGKYVGVTANEAGDDHIMAFVNINKREYSVGERINMEYYKIENMTGTTILTSVHNLLYGDREAKEDNEFTHGVVVESNDAEIEISGKDGYDKDSVVTIKVIEDNLRPYYITNIDGDIYYLAKLDQVDMDQFNSRWDMTVQPFEWLANSYGFNVELIKELSSKL